MALTGGKFTFLQLSVLLCLGLALVVGLTGTSKPSADSNQSQPLSSYSATATEVVVNRSADGHFWLDAQVNGTSVRFLVDTGASLVILTEEDADRIGFHLSKQDYSLSFSTANGAAAAAPVRLDEVEVGDIEIRNVTAAVNNAPMPQSLLGMSFLERLAGFEVQGDRLILRR